MESSIRQSKTNPKFLQSNATSHSWTFSAFAELIDNAYDPDVRASQLMIDMRVINDFETLVFTDNGNGMNEDKLEKMLSFGFSDKMTVGGHRPIGMYGNGFKSGSMKLGKDAIVFTKNGTTMSVGMLSQSYLEAIGADTVRVPIVTWDQKTGENIPSPGSDESLAALLRYSIFEDMESLIAEFKFHKAREKHGTKIIIWTLKKNPDQIELELDFSDQYDIRNPNLSESNNEYVVTPTKKRYHEYRVSLRKYCEILYLKPRMKIILRGKKVRPVFITKSLSRSKTDFYRPKCVNRNVNITFGFSQNKEEFGMMMYHKNRLVKAYEPVGFQKQQNDMGVGVIGVIDTFFLKPTHNKQDFEVDATYNACMSSLSQKLNDYWNETKMEEEDAGSPETSASEQIIESTWAMCDNSSCLKWRRLPPPPVDPKTLPEKWYCFMNPDRKHNSCDVPEEQESQGEAQIRRNKKTFKRRREEQTDAQYRQLKIRESELSVQEENLRQEQAILVTEQERQQQLSQAEPLLPAELAEMQQSMEENEKQIQVQAKKLAEISQQKKKLAEEIKRFQVNDAVNCTRTPLKVLLPALNKKNGIFPSSDPIPNKCQKTYSGPSACNGDKNAESSEHSSDCFIIDNEPVDKKPISNLLTNVETGDSEPTQASPVAAAGSAVYPVSIVKMLPISIVKIEPNSEAIERMSVSNTSFTVNNTDTQTVCKVEPEHIQHKNTDVVCADSSVRPTKCYSSIGVQVDAVETCNKHCQTIKEETLPNIGEPCLSKVNNFIPFKSEKCSVIVIDSDDEDNDNISAKSSSSFAAPPSVASQGSSTEKPRLKAEVDVKATQTDLDGLQLSKQKGIKEKLSQLRIDVHKLLSYLYQDLPLSSPENIDYIVSFLVEKSESENGFQSVNENKK